MDSFLKLDIFRKLPKDLTEPTFCGGFVSLLCSAVLIFLTVSEINTYIKPSTSSEIAIATSHA
jgi:hypothetical protein